MDTRDSIELAEFNCVISFLADSVRSVSIIAQVG